MRRTWSRSRTVPAAAPKVSGEPADSPAPPFDDRAAASFARRLVDMAEALTVVVLVAAFLAVAGVAAVAVYRLWTSSGPDESAPAPADTPSQEA